ncbi:MAG: ATP-binding protein YdiB [Berkelbacteria bacterium GW2011_GWA2_35_9]|uniref:tRNA threonylcarbamoyladenosine biosynthesis protein TsaE n=1 Tax=Berkelbacteria bacterium GW2011_GWA2_35_9 TaxID=1618333 RepID=A0A0G0D4H8_9BACT|nr:MAG: ATP-binding protein YdiB [Berkelbacteria bacterium GW2011_GWA2_35_9]
MEINIKNINQSLKFTDIISKKFQPGVVVGFVGELGAGKTTIIKQIAKNLGVKETVTSPTFVIYKKYRTQLNCNLVHIDAYRLSNNSDIVIKEIIENQAKNIVLVEWADKINMPKGSLMINIQYNEKNINMRKINYEIID